MTQEQEINTRIVALNAAKSLGYDLVSLIQSANAIYNYLESGLVPEIIITESQNKQ